MSLNTATYRVSDVQTHVKRQFGDESGVQINNSDILRWINMGQVEIATITRSMQAVATTSFTDGVFKYPLPSAAALEILAVTLDGAPIQGVEFSDAQANLVGNDPTRTQTGLPQYWYRWVNDLYFWPTPDATTTGVLEVYYLSVPEELNSESDLLGVPDKFYEALIQYVMSKAYELDEDYEASKQARDLFNQRLGDNFDDEKGETLFYPTIIVVDED